MGGGGGGAGYSTLSNSPIQLGLNDENNLDIQNIQFWT